jgi:CAAX protease family protein
MLSPAFLRYVDRAREGRVALWCLGVGIVVILLVWAAVTVLAFVIGVFVGGLGLGGGDPQTALQDFLASPAGVATALASFLGMSVGVFLAVRLVQGRAFGTVLGTSGRLAWRDFWRGLAAALIASATSELATFFVDPSLRRSAIGLVAWLIWLGPTLVLLLIQVSAEELTFRGYLLQSLAARFRSPFVWALLPLALFTALHWNALLAPPMQAAMLVSIAAFAAAATVLVVRTGNLGAGVGMHFGLNTFGIIFVSHTSWLSGAALFRGQPVDVGEWSGLDSFFFGLFGAAPFALVLLFLLHPRSPLRVGEA